jgi:small subunit ribosomal protein S10
MKIQLKIKSVDERSLKLYLIKLKKILKVVNIQYKTFNLPLKRKRITLLKSPHVNKTAREQFEIKTNSVLFQIVEKNKAKMLKILSLNKPKTVSISIKSI